MNRAAWQAITRMIAAAAAAAAAPNSAFGSTWAAGNGKQSS